MNQEYALVPRVIVESELFYMMPVSAQVLYFHAAVLANHGAVEVPAMYDLIQRIGCSKEDLEILLQKGYVSKNEWFCKNKQRYFIYRMGFRRLAR